MKNEIEYVNSTRTKKQNYRVTVTRMKNTCKLKREYFGHFLKLFNQRWSGAYKIKFRICITVLIFLLFTKLLLL